MAAADGSERTLPNAPMRLMTPRRSMTPRASIPTPGRYPQKSWKARRVPHQDITPRARSDPGRIRIPLGTLRDWEQSRFEPDQPARLAHGPDEKHGLCGRRVGFIAPILALKKTRPLGEPAFAPKLMNDCLHRQCGAPTIMVIIPLVPLIADIVSRAQPEFARTVG